MQNNEGEFVDIYKPRRCTATNQLIGAKDHASIQIRFVDLDPQTGRFNGKYHTFDIAGNVRAMGESDDAINRLSVKSNIIPKTFHEGISVL